MDEFVLNVVDQIMTLRSGARRAHAGVLLCHTLPEIRTYQENFQNEENQKLRWNHEKQGSFPSNTKWCLSAFTTETFPSCFSMFAKSIAFDSIVFSSLL